MVTDGAEISMSRSVVRLEAGSSSSHANPTDRDRPRGISLLQDLIAGGIAGSAGVVVGHPFDTYKVRLQTGRATTTLSGGFGSLFRGIGAPFAAAAFVSASVFCTFGESARLWDRHYEKSSFWKPFACGSFTGIVTSFIICPTEHIKCRLQTQGEKGGAAHKYRGSFDAARRILGSHGVLGLYRGWCATCLRQGPSFGLYFATYGHLKTKANRMLGSDDGRIRHDREWVGSVLAGGAAGSLAWAVVYPMDVIKSRIQILPLDSRDAAKIWNVANNTVRKEGWRSLYRGLSVTVLRAFPVNGIIFPVYEYSLTKLEFFGKEDDVLRPK